MNVAGVSSSDNSNNRTLGVYDYNTARRYELVVIRYGVCVSYALPLEDVPNFLAGVGVEKLMFTCATRCNRKCSFNA